MISLALEDDQQLDLNCWEEWLANFPAIAKHVKVQGVFKSHSTLLLLSLPVMVWDLLPDDPACAFIAFIRSNNLLRAQDQGPPPPGSSETSAAPNMAQADTDSFFSGTTAEEHTWGARRQPAPVARQQEQQVDSRITPPAGSSALDASQGPRSEDPTPRTIPGPQSSTLSLASPLRAESTTSLRLVEPQHASPPALPTPSESDTTCFAS